ncbi:hypothetical protein ACFZB9_33505 [Kitasatospora sp. NPDC008050]|uniref:hypothetical protein n=1 Tax=Kitasatospora sp. NPDC008050 TaxID=3364021 RepID=UPI0036F16A45
MSLETPATDTPSEGLSRRHLMRQAAAVGAAGLAVNLLASAGAEARPADTQSANAQPAGQNSAGASDPAAPADAAEQAQPMVVHVRDVRAGHLDLYRGESHQRVQDPALAAALARAMG